MMLAGAVTIEEKSRTVQFADVDVPPKPKTDELNSGSHAR